MQDQGQLALGDDLIFGLPSDAQLAQFERGVEWERGLLVGPDGEDDTVDLQ